MNYELRIRCKLKIEKSKSITKIPIPGMDTEVVESKRWALDFRKTYNL